MKIGRQANFCLISNIGERRKGEAESESDILGSVGRYARSEISDRAKRSVLWE